MQDDKTSKEEAEWVKSVLNGNADDFRRLVEAHQDAVISYILRVVGDRQTSLDLAQDTFIRAYKGLKHFRFESQFRTWLFTIAMNVTRSYFSSRRFKEARLSVSDSIPERASSENPESVILAQRLQMAISLLPTCYRDVMMLCALQGCTYEECAKQLRIPVGTVRSRLNQARLLLSKSLFDQGE